MNYYQPRQRKADGRRDYTAMNDGMVRPVGYCHAYHPIPDEIPYMTPEMVRRENDREAAFAHKYHDDGHATEAEARACYKEYLLDHKLELNIENAKHVQ